MKLEDLLKIQLENDILNELYELYELYSNSLDIPFEEYKKICQSKIKNEIQDLSFFK